MQSRKQNIILAVFCLIFISATGQTNQLLRNQIVQAEQNKDWYAAAQYYLRLYSRDSTNIKMMYSYAEASRLTFDLDVAIRLYNRIAAIDNGRKFPLTFYHLGQLQKNKQKYKLAQQWFTKFYKLKISERKSKKQNLAYYKMRAKMELDACDMSQILLKYPVLQNPDHLDQVVNSKLSEYAPFEKDSTLYFSSVRIPERKPARDEEEERSAAAAEANRPAYSKIYRSDIRNQKYKKIKALDTTFNSNVFHSANTTFSPDNKIMIISRCTARNASEYVCDLYQSSLLKTRWLTPVKMEAPVNQPSVSTTQPNFGTIGGKTALFFVSDRPGGEGGLDIWYCFRDDHGTYSEPVNAGKTINTPEDEVSPWFHTEKSTLYFSSAYHNGFGGFDIFKSEFKGEHFGDPVNAGFPINSSHNDVYYSQNAAGTKIYLSSNRVGSFFENKVNCCNDIYKFTVDTTVVRPPVVDTTSIVKEQLKLLVPLTLYFHNDEPEPRTTVTVTAKTYETTYNEYKALAPQYISQYAENLKGQEKNIATNQIENFFADSVDAGLEGLKKFTDLLDRVLRNGETVKITMKGYCSPLASTNYNINLAKRRISSLRNYFLKTREGFFLKYIENPAPGLGRIIFEDVDIGELPASKVSDNFKDKRNSVYSPYAASERKIQIIAVSYGG